MHPVRKHGVFLQTSARKHSHASWRRDSDEDEAHVVKRSVRTDRAALLEVSHLAHDRRDTARAEAGRAAADELRERAEELALGEGGLEREEVVEDAGQR